MLAGAKLGAMAGAIGGPIGVAIGGVLGGAVGMFFGDRAGQIIGDTVGGWVSDLREADIPGKIVGARDATIDFLKKGWDGALEKLSDAWKGIKDAGSRGCPVGLRKGQCRQQLHQGQNWRRCEGRRCRSQGKSRRGWRQGC
ncbi:hypothetical protein MASR1M42_10420 [Azonexus hydrophilus]